MDIRHLIAYLLILALVLGFVVFAARIVRDRRRERNIWRGRSRHRR
jgi:hypothetical protein